MLRWSSRSNRSKRSDKGSREVKCSYQCCTVMFRFGGIFDRSCGTCWTFWNDRIWSLLYNWATASSKALSTALYWWCYRWCIHGGDATATTSAAKERNVAGYRLRCSGTHWRVIKCWKGNTISQSGRLKCFFRFRQSVSHVWPSFGQLWLWTGSGRGKDIVFVADGWKMILTVVRDGHRSVRDCIRSADIH